MCRASVADRRGRRLYGVLCESIAITAALDAGFLVAKVLDGTGPFDMTLTKEGRTWRAEVKAVDSHAKVSGSQWLKHDVLLRVHPDRRVTWDWAPGMAPDGGVVV